MTDDLSVQLMRLEELVSALQKLATNLNNRVYYLETQHGLTTGIKD